VRWFFALIVATGAAAVSGCSTTSTNTQVKTIHQVAVVSMLGNTFHGVQIAATGLRGAHYDANVVDWRLDDDIADYLRTQLLAIGISAKRLDISPKRTEDFYSKPLFSNDQISIQGYASPEPHYAELCPLALAQGNDILVILGRTAAPHLSVVAPGYGLVDVHFLGRAHRNIYTAIAIGSFNTRDCAKRSFANMDAPNPKPDNALPWEDSYEAFNADEKAQLKAAIEAQLRSKIDQALVTMKLVAQGLD
jgi:hypothetical protein